jgi:DNA invertase Pin-like site-specific DNA recombinase
LTWDLSRLCREGVGPALEIVNRLGKAEVEVWSLQEPWSETSGELRDLLLAMVGWVARYESTQRSERTRAGLARALSEGKRLGRPPGAKDGKKRSRRGYLLRYAK